MAYSKTSPDTWETRYSSASGNQAKLFKRFSNWYDSLYAIVGVNPSPWRSKIYVPVLARQTWALVSKFLSLKPGFEVRVMDEELGQEELATKAEKAQRKLEYDYNNPYLDESIRDKLFAPLLDATVTGTGLAKVCWRVEKRTTYTRPTDRYGNVDQTKEKKTTKTVGYNDLEPVNIFNVFVSPSATNLYSAPWIIIKEFKTMDELKAVNEAQGVAIYKNLDKLSGTTTFDDDMNSYNRSRNRLMNAQDRQDSTVKLVKLYECYEGSTICTYAESQSGDSDKSWILLREQRNPYWHGKYPLVKFHVKNRPFQFWGEGLFETTYRLQAGYNDVFNHFMDQWNLAENSMLITNERSNVNDYVVEPGGVITYRGDQPPQQFKHSMPDGGMLQEILGLMDSAIEGVTISQYASGIPNSESDKTKGTASGIRRLQEAAGDLVTFMRANFTQSITQIGRMWLSNNQQYMQQDVGIMVNTKGRLTPMTVTPQDMQGDMDLLVDEASMEPSTKEEQRQNYVAFLAQILGMKQAADVQHQQIGTPPLALNFAELAEDMAERFGMKNFQSSVVPDEEVQQLQQQAQQSQQAMMQPQAPAVQPKQPSESINYKDATPFIQAQIEEQAGLQADPVHATQHEAMLQQMQPQEQASNPQADQATVDMAHQLASQGHLDPSMLAHLPPLPAQTQAPQEDPQSFMQRLVGGNRVQR